MVDQAILMPPKEILENLLQDAATTGKGIYSEAVREYFPDLKDSKYSDPSFQKTLKLGRSLTC